MGDAEVVLMHPLMVLVRGIGGGAITSATGAKARIGGAHRVEYSQIAHLSCDNPAVSAGKIGHECRESWPLHPM